jgi:hypothetical protein
VDTTGLKLPELHQKIKLAADFLRRLCRMAAGIFLAYQKAMVENKSKNTWSNAIRFSGRGGKYSSLFGCDTPGKPYFHQKF